MKEYLNVHVVLEPHERWQRVGDTENLLDHFYKDPSDGHTPFNRMRLFRACLIMRFIREQIHILFRFLNVQFFQIAIALQKIVLNWAT